VRNGHAKRAGECRLLTWAFQNGALSAEAVRCNTAPMDQDFRCLRGGEATEVSWATELEDLTEADSISRPMPLLIRLHVSFRLSTMGPTPSNGTCERSPISVKVAAKLPAWSRIGADTAAKPSKTRLSEVVTPLLFISSNSDWPAFGNLTWSISREGQRNSSRALVFQYICQYGAISARPSSRNPTANWTFR